MRAVQGLLGITVVFTALLAGRIAVAETVVSPGNMGDWAFAQTDSSGDILANGTGVATMVTGPATPPLGVGSAQLATGSGAGDGASQITSTGYAGVALSSLTALSYSAYDTTNNGSQFPYMQLALCWNPKVETPGTVDDILFFEPPYQTPTTGNPKSGQPGGLINQATVMNTWQTWNALNGGWWSDVGVAGFGPGDNVGSLAAYLKLYPNAAIVNYPDTMWGGPNPSGITEGGIGLYVGYAGPDDNFNGYVDNVTIGTTTYDFEPASSPENSSTPEPSSLVALLGLSATGLVGFWRRRRAAA
jgi:hypothetical protein